MIDEKRPDSTDEREDDPLPVVPPARDGNDDPLGELVGVVLVLGILGVIIGTFIWRLWDGATTSAVVFLVVGFGMIGLYLFYNAEHIVKSFAKKRALVGANVLVMLILATVVLVLVSAFNGCAEGLSDESTLGKVGLGRLLKHNLVRETLGRNDLTRAGDHVISDETHKVLEGLDDTLFMIFVDMRDRQTTRNPKYGNLFKRMDALLDEYRFASPEVVVYSIDAIANPEQARRVFSEAGLLSDDLPTRDTVVLAYGGKRQDIPLKWDELMRTGSYQELFMGERVLTAGILGLTSDKKKILFLRGHNEKDPRGDRGPATVGRAATDYSEVNSSLLHNNYEVDVLSLATQGRVPEDCGILVIAGPNTALSPTEVNAVKAYLDGGGAMLLLVDPQPGSNAYGLAPVLGEYGIKAMTDMLCHVWIAQQAIVTRDDVPVSTILVPESEYKIHPIVEPLLDRYNTLYEQACVVDLEVVEGVESYELFRMPELTTRGQPSPNFAVKLNQGWQDRVAPKRGGGVREEAGDIIGSVPLAVVASREVEGAEPAAPGEKAPLTRIVVIGDSDFVLDKFLVRGSRTPFPANLALLMNAVNWLGGREKYIAIEPKTLEFARERADVSRFDHEQRQLYERSLLAVPVILIPLLVAFMGFVVWWRRRR